MRSGAKAANASAGEVSTFGRNIWQKFTRRPLNGDKWIKCNHCRWLSANIVFFGVNEVSIRRQCRVNTASIFVNELVAKRRDRLLGEGRRPRSRGVRRPRSGTFCWTASGMVLDGVGEGAGRRRGGCWTASSKVLDGVKKGAGRRPEKCPTASGKIGSLREGQMSIPRSRMCSNVKNEEWASLFP